MESWDDDNFDPKFTEHLAVKTNKWEGEDEDDDVKDNWEDEDEEPKEEAVKEVAPKPKKQTLDEKIAHRAQKKKEEYEKRLKEEEEEEITEAERVQRQKDSDLYFALETTFGDSNSSNLGLDAMHPTTKEEYQEFSDLLSSKIQALTKNAEFPTFAENIIRSICATLPSGDIKKIKTTIDNLYLEKQKIEKGEKAKKNKGKGKAKLKMDNENQFSAYVDDDYNDYHDFM